MVSHNLYTKCHTNDLQWQTTIIRTHPKSIHSTPIPIENQMTHHSHLTILIRKSYFPSNLYTYQLQLSHSTNNYVLLHFIIYLTVVCFYMFHSLWLLVFSCDIHKILQDKKSILSNLTPVCRLSCFFSGFLLVFSNRK